MKTVELKRYQCEICGAQYANEAEAKRCESVPRREDKGVKPGDLVRVLSGDGAGRLATVTSVFVYDKDWGHYAAERYWHTVGVTAKIVDDWGSRQLTFDAYEVKK